MMLSTNPYGIVTNSGRVLFTTTNRATAIRLARFFGGNAVRFCIAEAMRIEG